MSETQKVRGGKGYKQTNYSNTGSSAASSSLVFGCFWALLFVSTFLVGGPWAGFHALLLAGAGLLMLLCPPAVSLPRLWWILAALFVVPGLAQFLPASWFPMPEWRGKLEALGLDTGKLVVIQSRQAVEIYTLFVITLLTGLWFAGHRATNTQLHRWSLTFVIGVAIYAILSKIHQQPNDVVYGFFPNRNHTSTYLAMGSICGLGCILQALRDKRFVAMAAASVATAICLGAVAGWSISRGGVALVVVGSLAWVSMLGRRYLGQHGMRALGLIALAAVGFFFLADTAVKDRMSQVIQKANRISTASEGAAEMDNQGQDPQNVMNLDFRLPTALDTFDLIRDFKWTGVGAGQFDSIFPQYRNLTAVLNHTESYHPESDWLWMASEVGVPATLSLAALVVVAFMRALKGVLAGKDRALRGACLVAAALVPFHGIFDVPGHRMTLAWCSVFLFVLSLHIPHESRLADSPLRRWSFRMAALGLLACAALFANAEWWGGNPPAFIAGYKAVNEAKKLRAEDTARQKAAFAENKSYQPNPEDDVLEKALQILQKSRNAAPLDRSVLNLQGTLALNYEDKLNLVEDSFTLARALDPTWVNAPLLQAQSWSTIDPVRTAALWAEGLERARKLDQAHPGTTWSEKETLVRIQRFAKGKKDLEPLVPIGNGG